MTATELAGGILDTSTVMLLELIDENDLPAAPLITAVTLAELPVGPLVAGCGASVRSCGRVAASSGEEGFRPAPMTP